MGSFKDKFSDKNGARSNVLVAVFIFVMFSASFPKVMYFILFCISMSGFHYLYERLFIDKNYDRDAMIMFLQIQLIVIIITLIHFFVSSNIYIPVSLEGRR